MTPSSTPPIPVTVPQLDVVGLFTYLYDAARYTAWGDFFDIISILWSIYAVFAILISLLFFSGIIYAKIRYAELAEIEAEDIKKAEAAWAARNIKPTTSNARWDVIQRRVGENSPEAWRIAIIEADILLEETLTNAGYVGQSLGEKLKSANPQSFRTVQDAWDAHKVRNEIAHVGSDFILTQRAAQETIVKFERVFREFGVI